MSVALWISRLPLITRSPDPGGADGEFTEYDLDEGGAPVPVDRAPGSNVANLVLGVVSTPTKRYPEGLRRVVLLGDPTRGLGNLAEPECRRILAALDLADTRAEFLARAGEMFAKTASLDTIVATNLRTHRSFDVFRGQRAVELVDWSPDSRWILFAIDPMASASLAAGILADIGSHQADQFLLFTGSTRAEVVAAHVAMARERQAMPWVQNGNARVAFRAASRVACEASTRSLDSAETSLLSCSRAPMSPTLARRTSSTRSTKRRARKCWA